MGPEPRAGFATRALAMLLDVLVVDAAAVVVAVGVALTARLLGATSARATRRSRSWPAPGGPSPSAATS